MQFARIAPTDSPEIGVSRKVDVVVGLSGGAHVRGCVTLPALWRLHDLLNNVREPFLKLDNDSQAPQRGSVTLNRSNVAWIGSLQSDPPGNGDNDMRGELIDHAVIVHAGPFELHGKITTYRGVEWSNFLVGRAGPPAEFFVLTDARITGITDLPMSTLAVNVALLAALSSLN